jgi:hypothetical protein
MEEAKSFENQWNAAFDGAEMTPSEHVWVSIDGALANQEAGVFKKRMLFFKWVAAASVTIALATVSVLFIQNNQTDLVVLEAINGIENSELITNELPKDKNDIPQSESSTEIANAINNSIKKKGNNEKTTENQNNLIPSLKVDVQEEENSSLTLSNIEANQLALLPSNENKIDKTRFSFNRLTAKQLRTIEVENPTLPDELYGVAQAYAIEIIKEKYDFSLSAGLSVASGNFDPNTTKSGTDQSFSLAADLSENITSEPNKLFLQTNEESLSSGSSISAGLDFNGRISPKVVISSGVHFLKNNSTFNSNLIVSDANTGETYALSSDELSNSSFQNTLSTGSFSAQNSESNFNNEFQYVSIPLKAGYVLLDKKFNIILNSGLSTNFLLSASQQNFDGQTQLYPSETSFKEGYRPVYFNFLSSIAFGYNIQKKYILSIEPSYSQALTDFTKSANTLSGKPRDLGLSVGLKYNF